MANPKSSGDGSRPTTDGGIDNIGGADSFTPGQKGGDSSPAPSEKMADRRSDRAAAEQDDSAPFGLTPSVKPTKNTETP